MDHASSTPSPRRLALIAGGAVATLLALEIATEEGGVSPLELTLEVLELGLTIAAAGALTLLFARMQAQHEERISLIRALDAARTKGEGWRKQVQAHLEGLGAAIERQFEEWCLTDAEKEVALLMLKGFSHREIGRLRSTSEATVRQQARSAYQKSGMNGRAAFCAFFLEDLLPPRPHTRSGDPVRQVS